MRATTQKKFAEYATMVILGSKHNEYKRVQTPVRDYNTLLDKETVAR